MPYIGIQKNWIILKLLQPILGALKARAPPWQNLPIMQSCVSPRLSAPSNNPPGVKLLPSCQRTLATHHCLPGDISSLLGAPLLTMLYMLLLCLWLFGQPALRALPAMLKAPGLSLSLGDNATLLGSRSVTTTTPRSGDDTNLSNNTTPLGARSLTMTPVRQQHQAR